MIIGGIAVIARGVRRMTADIDAVVLGGGVDVGQLFRVLARHACDLESRKPKRSRSTPASYGRASYPMARAEDLVVFKALAARPKDIEDAAALTLMHPGIDLARVRRRLADLAALAEEPALLDGLEQVIARTRAVRRAARKRSGVTPSRRPTPKRAKPRAPPKK